MNKEMNKADVVVEVSTKIIVAIFATWIITSLYYYSWIILYP
mgnify:CR=1 FL=1|jgi:hypothetical protein